MASKASATARRTMFLLMCWLYISLGCACLAGGVYLLFAASRVSYGTDTHSVTGVRALAGLLIAFGVWRSFLAIYHIRRVLRPR